MSLDIYVGSLTRYLTGDWDRIAQKPPDKTGQSRVEAGDPEVVRPNVLAWRDGLSEALADHITEPLDWNENAEAPYFTEQPNWYSYGNLIVWAAYNEQPGLRRPESGVDDWPNDEAYLASTAEGFDSKYSHLFGVELWLPCPFGIVFKAEDVKGKPVLIGSSLALLEHLEELNQRTWQAGPIQLSNWAHDGAEEGASMETGAQCAFAHMLKLTTLAVEEQLPIRLVYP